MAWRMTATAALLVAIHVALSLGYRSAVPLFNWPDEPAHLNHVRAVAAGELLPTMRPGAWSPRILRDLVGRHFDGAGPDDLRVLQLTYEHHQPPLYYLLAAAVWRGTGRADAVKLVNLGLSSLVVLLPFAVARARRWSDPWRAVVAGSLLAVHPMRCFLAVGVGNGVLAELLFGLFVVAACARLRALTVGVVIGLGVLTKVSVLVALPLYVGWCRLDGSSRSWRRAVVKGSVAGAATVAISLPWVAHNVSVYGLSDPLALRSGAFGSADETVAAGDDRRPTLELRGEHGLVRFAATLYQSWWGTFGWMEMVPDRRALTVYGGVTLLALVGLWRCRGRPTVDRTLTSWSGVAVASMVAAVVLYSLVDTVQVMRFHRQGQEDPKPLGDGFMTLGALEIARLDGDPNFPEHGLLRLDLVGGK